MSYPPEKAAGRTGAMGSPTSSTAASDRNRRSREWSRPSGPSEAPPTWAPMAGVLGELSFYYAACWLHYRSAPQRPEEKARGRW